MIRALARLEKGFAGRHHHEIDSRKMSRIHASSIENQGAQLDTFARWRMRWAALVGSAAEETVNRDRRRQAGLLFEPTREPYDEHRCGCGSKKGRCNREMKRASTFETFSE